MKNGKILWILSMVLIAAALALTGCPGGNDNVTGLRGSGGTGSSGGKTGTDNGVPNVPTPSTKSITITGITDTSYRDPQYNLRYFNGIALSYTNMANYYWQYYFNPLMDETFAKGEGIVSDDDSLTIPSEDFVTVDGSPWTGSGSYCIYFYSGSCLVLFERDCGAFFFGD